MRIFILTKHSSIFYTFRYTVWKLYCIMSTLNNTTGDGEFRLQIITFETSYFPALIISRN